MERLTDRIGQLTDDQLRALTVAFFALSAVMGFIVLALLVAPGILGPSASSGGDVGATATVTPTLRVAQLPPTWTPTQAPTLTPSRTPVPPTASPTGLATNEDPLLPTATPDYNATAQAILSTPATGSSESPSSPLVGAPPTATSPPIAPPTLAPPPPLPPTLAPPTFPPVAPPPIAVPTQRPPATFPPPPPPPTLPPVPTVPPLPTEPPPTPTPPYIVRSLEGGSGCEGVRTFGTVYAASGLIVPGITVRMYNDTGFDQTRITDAGGNYEFFLANVPGPEIAGNWHWEIRDNGALVSPIISYPMTGQCGNGPHLFKLDWLRTIP